MEIVIVILVITILLAIAVPSFIRARETSRQKSCVSNITQIEHAKEQFAMETFAPEGAAVTMMDIVPSYIKHEPFCPAGGTYDPQPIGMNPLCTFAGHTLP
jgi:Tfp pilus assembly protein PilE